MFDYQRLRPSNVLQTWTAGASKPAAFAELVASPAEEAMPGHTTTATGQISSRKIWCGSRRLWNAYNACLAQFHHFAGYTTVIWGCIKTLVPLVNIKIAVMDVHPTKNVSIGIDPYPNQLSVSLSYVPGNGHCRTMGRSMGSHCGPG
jgi:hypothetical protein